MFDRKNFIITSSKLLATGLFGTFMPKQVLTKINKNKSGMKFGLVTYQWGKDWKLSELIRNCETADVHGVELRVDHAHGVGPAMNERQRHEVKLRFENTPVQLVGLGTNYSFHYANAKKLHADIEGAKEYVRLSYDIGGTGVKVKPNELPEEVSEQQTIDQIGVSLNELGEYAKDMGQEIRLEVHGRGTQRLPIIKRIFDVVDQPNVGVNWNCNEEDLKGEGLRHNFNLVKDDLGQTVHIRDLSVDKDYPYQQLFELFTDAQYNGWILLEASTKPKNRIKALHQQKELFNQMTDNIS